MIILVEKSNIAINTKNITSIELHKLSVDDDSVIYIIMANGNQIKSDVLKYDELKPIFDDLINKWQRGSCSLYKI